MDAGEVSLEVLGLSSGYIAHPAVTDNCMQLGPVCSALQRYAGVGDGTRIVAGVSALQVPVQRLDEIDGESLL